MAAGSESFLNWGDGVIWSGFLQQQRRGRWWRSGGAEGVEGGKGRKAGRKRQELAPIAIVNPLLAHGDILGLESHKKSSVVQVP